MRVNVPGNKTAVSPESPNDTTEANLETNSPHNGQGPIVSM